MIKVRSQGWGDRGTVREAPRGPTGLEHSRHFFNTVGFFFLIFSKDLTYLSEQKPAEWQAGEGEAHCALSTAPDTGLPRP